MGKVCWINGQPYLVFIPSGGKSEKDLDNPWDQLIGFLGEDCDDIFHWRSMYSWCQEAVNTPLRVFRGYHSARNWNYDIASERKTGIGFRPVLTPLDPATLKPDYALLEDIPNGSRIALMSLYMDGKVIAEPQKPVWSGDIRDYIIGSEIILGGRDKDSKNWIHVIKHNDLLWVDRVLLKNISWHDLEEQGFTE